MISFASKSCLVIEDQSFIRGVIVRILRQLEFASIIEAEDGQAGLELASGRDPDVIIADIEMEPVDGLTFLRALRKKEGNNRHTPVIFLTNHANKDTVLKARDLGVDAFIAKPVTLTSLREKLVVLIGKP